VSPLILLLLRSQRTDRPWPRSDVFDAVLLIMTDAAMQTFYNHKVTLGGEVGVAAGVWGAGAIMEAGTDRSPVYSYLRSRGFYAGAEAIAQVYLTRFDENERMYYCKGVTQREIVGLLLSSPPRRSVAHSCSPSLTAATAHWPLQAHFRRSPSLRRTARSRDGLRATQTRRRVRIRAAVRVQGCGAQRSDARVQHADAVTGHADKRAGTGARIGAGATSRGRRDSPAATTAPCAGRTATCATTPCDGRRATAGLARGRDGGPACAGRGGQEGCRPGAGERSCSWRREGGFDVTGVRWSLCSA